MNIVSADFFGITFMQYAGHMWLPTLFSLGASILVLYLFFRRSIPKVYDTSVMKLPAEAIKDLRMFKLSWVILALLLIGYFVSEFLDIPVSAVAGVIAVIFLLLARRSPSVNTREVVRNAPWAIVFFSIGMYVVVYGLRNVGLTDVLAEMIGGIAAHGLFAATMGMGFLAALLSSVMNNLPTVLIGAIAVDTAHTGDCSKKRWSMPM